MDTTTLAIFFEDPFWAGGDSAELCFVLFAARTLIIIFAAAETSPRRLLFDFAERNPAVGAEE